MEYQLKQPLLYINAFCHDQDEIQSAMEHIIIFAEVTKIEIEHHQELEDLAGPEYSDNKYWDDRYTEDWNELKDIIMEHGIKGDFEK